MTTQTKLDLSQHRTAAEAAKALHHHLRAALRTDRDFWQSSEGFDYRGPDPDSVILRGPTDPDEEWAEGAWHVLWEGGPYWR